MDAAAKHVGPKGTFPHHGYPWPVSQPASPPLPMTAEERKRSLANLKLERDAIWLYDQLSAIETDPKRAATFKRIASNERRHADIWATRLTEMGATVPEPTNARARVRLIV